MDMATQDVAAALLRAETVLKRRPGAGIHDDSPAAARWQGGTRIVASHANGTEVATDMPAEFGGAGDLITPGWLFRAGLASCTATSIAMTAATQGIALSSLEVRASSRTDSRGMLGMAGADGQPVCAAPLDLQLHVRIAAQGVAPDRLRALAQEGCRRSPIPSAAQNALPLALHVDVSAG